MQYKITLSVMTKRYLSVEAADSQAAAAAAVQQYEAAARLVQGRVDDAATICTGWEAVQEESVAGSPSPEMAGANHNEPLSEDGWLHQVAR